MSIDTEEFVRVISDLFKEDCDRINAQTKFRELEEWSSMQALLVIAAIDEHFNVTIPEKEFRNANTLDELRQAAIAIVKYE